MNARDADNLIEKLKALPLERQAEVEDFTFIAREELKQRVNAQGA